jgi:hypothetical protein
MQKIIYSKYGEQLNPNTKLLLTKKITSLIFRRIAEEIKILE